MTQDAARSPWSPLRNRLFRSLWLATIVANVGTWMQDVGEGWLMTALTPSPAMIALVEAAGSLPVMLLAMPAGAIADIVDRRRLLLAIQVYYLAVVTALTVLTALDLTTPWILLGLTFAIGIGAAMEMPAWSAIVPELVPAEDLPAAIALNSVAINVSRAIGPAIAGVIIAAVGVWPVFALNAVSCFAIMAALWRWKRLHRKSSLPAERFTSAIRVGLRFVLHTRSLQAVLARGMAFFLFASATWSLFPVIVRRELGRGPETYGLLLTCIGLGAVAAAFALPRLRTHFRRDIQVAAASVLYAVAALALAYVRNLGLLAVAMLAIGVAWVAVLSALQVAAQLTLPEWVRARGLAAFVAVFMAGMTLGSILWGQLATYAGIPQTLTIAAAGMLAAAALTWRFHLVDKARDFTPSMDWTPPVLAETPEPDAGPVMVTIEYRVDPEKRKEFVAAMQPVREMRKRNGAYFWELFHDSAEPSRYLEIFLDESWTEHLRQHERASVADREIHARAKRFLQEPGTDGKSQHWLSDR